MEILHFTKSPSPVLTEMFCSLMRLLLRDHSISAGICSDTPPHLNFASRDDIKVTLDVLDESLIMEAYRDWSYNGLKLLPRKIRPEIVDGLRYQSVLRVLVPRLLSYRDIWRSRDVSLDLLIGSEQNEGLFREGYLTPNFDYKFGITSDFETDHQVWYTLVFSCLIFVLQMQTTLSAALSALEHDELFQLPLPQKLALLKQLTVSCYDTSIVRHLLARHADERISAAAAISNAQKDSKRKVHNDITNLKEAAIEECRRVNMTLLNAKSSKEENGEVLNSDCVGGPKKKSTGGKRHKNPFDPTPSQLSGMIEDLRLRKSLGLDVVLDEYPDDFNELSKAPVGRLLTSRAIQAEMDRRRKEVFQAKSIRQDAISFLEKACQSGKEKDIRESIKYAKQAGLEGVLQCGKKFCISALFQVFFIFSSKTCLLYII